jgi:hypothetical protein
MGDRVTQMIKIQTKALELFTRKNADYGDAFAKYGVIGVLIRIQDKIQRALSITINNITLVEDEGIADTMIDLHNYAAMALMLMEEGKADKYSDVLTESDTDSQCIHFIELEEGDENLDDLKIPFNPYDNLYTYTYENGPENDIEYGEYQDVDELQEV